MKTLLVLFALNAISRCHVIPFGGGFSGGFVKHGGFVAGPSASHYTQEEGISGGGGVGAAGGASFSASFGGVGGVSKTVAIEKHIAPLAHAEVVSEKILEVEAPPQFPVQPAKKTVIERTIIPNYVEKKIKVPTYVEKTIRVPTYVEKTIKVPAAPTVVEKTISQEDVAAPAGHKIVGTKVKVDTVAAVAPVEYDDVQVYHKYKARPHRVYHKEYVTGGGYEGGAGYGGSGFGRGVGGGSFSAHVGGGGAGGGLFDGIFNIPIQTLGAVRGFLNDLSGGGGFSGGASISKSYGVY